jgi:hypothetical protein
MYNKWVQQLGTIGYNNWVQQFVCCMAIYLPVPVPVVLRRRSWPLGNWDRGFESHSRCLSLCFYVVLPCVGRGLCDELITRPEESYQMS